MEFDYTFSSHSYHGYVYRLMPFPPMAYSKPLNPSAPPFRPVASPPPPLLPAFPLWYHPHRYRPLRVGGYGKKVVKRGVPHGGGRVRGFVPPRLMLTSREEEEEPRWCHGSESKQRWVPKDFKLRDDSSKSEKLTADEEDEDDVADAESSGLRGRTTVMMRNIPNLLKRQDLIEILDEHCHEANTNRSRLRSEYDFVYLPIDYVKKANKGYAFVNFTTPEAAVRMWRAFDGLKWEGFQWKCASYRSKKVCRICPATIQGNIKLEVSFRNRTFPSEEFQPVAAAAVPRDGMNGAPLSLVGKPSLHSGRGEDSFQHRAQTPMK